MAEVRLLETQKFIKEVKDTELANDILRRRLKLHIKKDVILGTASNKKYVFIYNYTDDSPKHHPIVNEANGLILTRLGSIVSPGIPRVYEIDDIEKPINWAFTELCQKVTGGIVAIFYFFNGMWQIQTLTDANAGTLYNESSVRPLNVEIMHHLMSELSRNNASINPFSQLNSYFTYVINFKRNNNFVRSEDFRKVTLLAVLDRYSGKRLPTEHTFIAAAGKALGVDTVTKVRVKSEAQARAYMRKANMDSAYLLEPNNGMVSITKDENKESIDKNAIRHIAKCILMGEPSAIKEKEKYKEIINMFRKAKINFTETTRKLVKQYLHMSELEIERVLGKMILCDIVLDIKKCKFSSPERAIEAMSPDMFLNLVKVKYWSDYEKAIQRSK